MTEMGMTESEALLRIKDMEYECMDSTIHYFTDKDIPMLRLSEKALEEIQQYRAIGTVEDIQMIFQLCKDLQVMCGKYHAIGTIEEFKALKEKNTPYKPKEYEDRYYACKCDNILLPKWRKYPTELMPKSEGLPHCMACGQKLDWQ